ncbi:MAG: hypothetical protein VX899_03110 [Myxococcota bacterium]|nr:hypothetical protein [Myxococcota bacterium]
MNSRDLEQIEAFLKLVGKPSLFAYYGVEPRAAAAEIEATVKKRRTWAQGQQANPKYRAEALWLIKNNALLRRVLLSDRKTYLTHVAQSQAQQGLKQLEPFMRGTLAGGVLTPEAEKAILDQGGRLGLRPEIVRAALDRLVQEVGARRHGEPAPRREAPRPRPTPKSDSFKDYYALLGITPEADDKALEAAHKAQYRAARSRRDKQAVSALYADLDEAWRVLTDPVRRAAYDAQWRANRAGIKSSDVSSDAVNISGFLPPPENHRVQTPPPPAAPIKTPPPAAKPPPVATPKPAVPGASSTPRTPPPEPTEESAPPRRGPPPQPEGIGGRTLGLGQTKRPRRATPRLSVASPEVISVSLGRKPELVVVVVKNIGDGKMAGRLTVDQGWVNLSRSRLDPEADQQEIELTINPAELPTRKGTAQLTIVTEHGERKSILVNAEKSGVSPALLIGGLVGLVAAAAAGLAIALSGGQTSLVVHVDPMADSIEINGQRVGEGSMLELTEGFPVDEPFVLHTELHGFSADERQIVVESGERGEIQVTLNPEPHRKPEAEADATVDPASLDQALERRSKSFADCLPQGSPELTVAADFYLGPTGELLYLSLDPAQLPDSQIADCINRQLHLVSYPGHGGTLAVAEAHSIRLSKGGS